MKPPKYPNLKGQWGKKAKDFGDKKTGKGQKLDRKELNHKEPWEVTYAAKHGRKHVLGKHHHWYALHGK